MTGRQQPRESVRDVCEPCTEYQAGARGNVTYAGAVIHACARMHETWLARECPCGCVVAATGGDETS